MAMRKQRIDPNRPLSDSDGAFDAFLAVMVIVD